MGMQTFRDIFAITVKLLCSEEVLIMKFVFDQWLTKESNFHKKFNKGRTIPLRVMFGVVTRQTDSCYYIEVYGKPEPTTKCLHCRRPLTNKASLFYGLGPTCGKYYGITGVTEENINANYDMIRLRLKEVTWKGLVPKKSVKIAMEDFITFDFIFNGKEYRVKTSDMTKIKQIRESSDEILREVDSKG